MMPANRSKKPPKIQVKSSSSSPLKCSCCLHHNGNKQKIYCQACLRHAIRASFERHQEALNDRDSLRSWCAFQLIELRKISNAEDKTKQNIDGAHLNGNTTIYNGPSQELSQLQEEHEGLILRREILGSQCANASVALVSASVNNGSRAAGIEACNDIVSLARNGLLRLDESILHSLSTVEDVEEESKIKGQSINPWRRGGVSLADEAHVSAMHVRELRFQITLKVFEMYRVDIGKEHAHLTLKSLLEPSNSNETNKMSVSTTSSKTTNNPIRKREERRVRERIPSGIGKIAGLPLPHAGLALYGVLPPDLLASSLRLVASLTSTLARCLGILLPHPIVLNYPDHDSQDIVDTMSNYYNDEHFDEKNKNAKYIKNGEKNHSAVITIQDLQQLSTKNDIQSNSQRRNEVNPKHESEMTSTHQHNSAEAHLSMSSCVAPSYMASSTHSLLQKMSSSASSTSSILSLVGSSTHALSGAARKMVGKMKGSSHHQHTHTHNTEQQMQSHTLSSLVQKSHTLLPNTRINSNQSEPNSKYSNLQKYGQIMNSKNISKLILNTSFAVVLEGREGQSRNVSYILRPPRLEENAPKDLKFPHKTMSNISSKSIEKEKKEEKFARMEEEFTIGLGLLQNNVVALAIQAGVPVSALWPAEALLLNIHSLHAFCESQVVG